MKRLVRILIAASAGVLASIVVAQLIAALFPALRGGGLIASSGSLISIFVAFAVYDALVARREKQ